MVFNRQLWVLHSELWKDQQIAGCWDSTEKPEGKTKGSVRQEGGDKNHGICMATEAKRMCSHMLPIHK